MQSELVTALTLFPIQILECRRQKTQSGQLKADFNPYGAGHPNGSRISPDEVANILRVRLKQKDIIETGMEIRFQLAALRFLPTALKDLKRNYEFVAGNRDLWVAVDLVGREDDDKDIGNVWVI